MPRTRVQLPAPPPLFCGNLKVFVEDGLIEVKASKAKTASRRLVPITENLKLWLVPHRKALGKVCQSANVTKQLLWLAETVNEKWQKETPAGAFVWKHNALRHSFISYRVAQVQNVAQVALEGGNSPRMVFSNCRELVRATDAEKWFAVTPASVEAAKAAREAGVEGKIARLPKTAVPSSRPDGQREAATRASRFGAARCMLSPRIGLWNPSC